MAWVRARDISAYQGAWQDTGEPIVMIKMSGGDGGSTVPNGLYYDTHATDNYSHAVIAGKAVGGYHFAGGGDPNVEAQWFVGAMSPLAENDVLALDWEIQHPNPVQWCMTFMQGVHNAINVWPLLYLNLNTLNSYDWSPVLQNCGLWLADWAVSPDATIPTNHVYVMQQYADGPGYDRDAWFGTIEEFKKYGYHAPVAAPAPPVSSPPATPADPASPPPPQTDTPPAPTTPPQDPSPVIVSPPVNPPSNNQGDAFMSFLQKHIPIWIGVALVVVNVLVDQKVLKINNGTTDIVNAILAALGLGVLHNRQS